MSSTSSRSHRSKSSSSLTNSTISNGSKSAPATSTDAETLKEILIDLCSLVPEIDDAIAEECLESNYANFEEIAQNVPPSVSDGTLLMSLQTLMRETENIDVTSIESSFWKDLTKEKCPPKRIAAVFWICMETSLTKESTLLQVQCGSKASSVYCRLCAIPGAGVIKFFQGELVLKSIQSWRLAFRVVVYGARNMEEMTANKPKKKGKKIDPEEVPTHDTLPRAEMLEILLHSTISLFIFLGKVSLQGMDNCAINVAQFVADIARIDHDKKDPRTTEVENLREFKARQRFSERSFALCHLLADERHSADASLIYERIIQPRLLLWSWENSPFGTALPMAIQHFADTTLDFVKHRMEHANEEEITTIEELVVALLLRCPDRSEYRNRVPLTIISLLKLLPKDQPFVFRKVLWELAQRSSSLSIVIEVCALMIDQFDWTQPDPTAPAVAEEIEMDKEMEVDEGVEEDVEMEEENETVREKEKMNKTATDRTEKGKQKGKKGDKPSTTPLPPGSSILFRILVDGCAHSSSNIRTRSLFLLAGLLKKKENYQLILDAAHDSHTIISHLGVPNAPEIATETKRISIALGGGNPFLPFLECCCKDFKSQVRKASCICIERYLPYATDNEFQMGLSILQRMCRDEAQVVRRQAAECVTKLLDVVGEDGEHWHRIADAWIADVFPMIGDGEAGVAEMVAGLVLELVLTPLLDANNKSVGGLAAEVLKKVYPGSSSRSDLIRALKDQASHNRLKSSVVSDVQKKLNDINSANIDDLWTLLDCLIRVFPEKADATFVLQKWNSFVQKPRSIDNWVPTPTIPYGTTSRAVLGIIRLVRARIGMDEKRRMINDLKKHLESHTVPSELVNEAWLTLASLLDHQKDSDIKMESEELKEFACLVYRNAIKVMNDIWYEEKFYEKMTWMANGAFAEGETFLVRMLLSTAYAAQYNLDLIYLLDKDTIDVKEPLMISYLLKLTTRCFSDLRDNLGRRRKDIKFVDDPNPYGHPIRRDGRWVPDAEWQRMRRAHSDVIVLFPPKDFPKGIRAAAAVSLGAHCLFDGELARDFLPEIIKEMHASDSQAVRANLLIPCCDMVKRYAVAEQLSPALATMLLDPHPLVRAQALEMLTHLIKEQFVKWEGLVMHMFTIMCVDDNAHTAAFAQSALKCALLPLMEDMLYSNFMEFLLFYNNAPFAWNADNGLIPVDRKKVRVSATGDDAARFVWRQTVMRFILSTFTDQQRFGSMVRMCTDILHLVAKGQLHITDPVISMLANDCLELMGCEEMEISYELGKKGEEIAEDEEPTDAIQAKATEAVMMCYRKGLQQRILPVLFDLLTLCEKQRLGSFARKITFTIEMLCKDHVDSLDEMLKSISPHRASELIAEITSADGFVQQELLCRRRDREDQRNADIGQLLRGKGRNTMNQCATPKIKRASLMLNAIDEHPINETLSDQLNNPGADIVNDNNDVPDGEGNDALNMKEADKEEMMTTPKKRNTMSGTMTTPKSILKKSISRGRVIREDNIRMVVEALTPGRKTHDVTFGEREKEGEEIGKTSHTPKSNGRVEEEERGREEDKKRVEEEDMETDEREEGDMEEQRDKNNEGVEREEEDQTEKDKEEEKANAVDEVVVDDVDMEDNHQKRGNRRKKMEKPQPSTTSTTASSSNESESRGKRESKKRSHSITPSTPRKENGEEDNEQKKTETPRRSTRRSIQNSGEKEDKSVSTIDVSTPVSTVPVKRRSLRNSLSSKDTNNGSKEGEKENNGGRRREGSTVSSTKEVEEKRNEQQSRSRSTKSSSVVRAIPQTPMIGGGEVGSLSDDTVLGGRAFSTPKNDHADIDLTFQGINESCIPKQGNNRSHFRSSKE